MLWFPRKNDVHLVFTFICVICGSCLCYLHLRIMVSTVFAYQIMFVSLNNNTMCVSCGARNECNTITTNIYIRKDDTNWFWCFKHGYATHSPIDYHRVCQSGLFLYNVTVCILVYPSRTMQALCYVFHHHTCYEGKFHNN